MYIILKIFIYKYIVNKFPIKCDLINKKNCLYSGVISMFCDIKYYIHTHYKFRPIYTKNKLTNYFMCSC